MKKGVMIINTSRGALVDGSAVIEGLKSEQIGYLGLDVYEQEADLFYENLSERIIHDDVTSAPRHFSQRDRHLTPGILYRHCPGKHIRHGDRQSNGV